MHIWRMPFLALGPRGIKSPYPFAARSSLPPLRLLGPRKHGKTFENGSSKHQSLHLSRLPKEFPGPQILLGSPQRISRSWRKGPKWGKSVRFLPPEIPALNGPFPTCVWETWPLLSPMQPRGEAKQHECAFWPISSPLGWHCECQMLSLGLCQKVQIFTRVLDASIGKTPRGFA